MRLGGEVELGPSLRLLLLWGFPKPFSRFWSLRWLLKQTFIGFLLCSGQCCRHSGAAAYSQDRCWIQCGEGLVVAEPASSASPSRVSKFCFSLLAFCSPFPSSKGLWFRDAYLWHILFPLPSTHFGSVVNHSSFKAKFRHHLLRELTVCLLVGALSTLSSLCWIDNFLRKCLCPSLGG